MKPLKPVMAALLAASSAAFALPRIALADDAANCAKKLDPNNAVNAVDCLLKTTPGAYADVGSRLAQFVLEKDFKGRAFVAPEALKNRVTVAAITAAAKGWPAAMKNDPKANIAALYVVVVKGSEKETLPAWTQVPELKEKLTPGDLRKRLELALSSDLDKSVPDRKAGDGTSGRRWTGNAQITASGAADATVAFLNDASAWAAKIFDDQRSKTDIQHSVDTNDTTAPNVPVAPAPAVPTRYGSSFDFNALYRDGAAVQNVWKEGDKGFRTLSVKMVSTRDADGNIINKIGVTDITEGDVDSPSAMQYVNLGSGESEVQCRPGGRRYVVSVSPAGVVTVRRKGAPNNDGSMSTDMTTLTIGRNDQIRRAGTVDIEGKSYYVIGQGGNHGSLLFFDKDAVDHRSGADSHPVLMGDVSKVLDDRTTGPITGKPPLGKLPNGKPYHLELRDGLWTVVPGEGDVPKTDKDGKDGKDKKGKGKGKNPDQTADGDQTDDQTADQPDDQTGDQAPATLDQIVAKSVEAGYEETGNESAELKPKMRILAKDGKYIVAFAPDQHVKGGQLQMPADIRDENKKVLGKFAGMRTFRGYVAVYYKPSMYYLSYENFLGFLRAGGRKFTPPAMGTFKPDVGGVVTKEGLPDVPSVELAEDMLVHYFEAEPESDVIKAVRAGVKKHAGGKPYSLTGNQDSVALHLPKGDNWMLWPKEEHVVTNETAVAPDAKGPGVVYSAGGGPLIPADPSKPETRFPEQVDDAKQFAIDANSGIALYKGPFNESGKQLQGYSAIIEYKKVAGGDDVGTTALMLFADGSNSFVPMPGPGKYHMRGLKGKLAGNNAQLRQLAHSTAEKGAWVMYKTPADLQSVKDKAGNCIGPIVWWGLSEGQVKTACTTDGAVP